MHYVEGCSRKQIQSSKSIKRNFNQGYMLLKGKEKATAEIALTVLAYNITRVINIIGLEKLINSIKENNLLKNRIIEGIKKFFIFVSQFLKEKYKKLNAMNQIYRTYFHFHTV